MYKEKNEKNICPVTFGSPYILGAQTSFFTIDLPTYTTIEIMYESLNQAMACYSSIDADETMNDAPNSKDFNSDIDSNK